MRGRFSTITFKPPSTAAASDENRRNWNTRSGRRRRWHRGTPWDQSKLIVNFFFFSYLNTKYIVGSFTLCTACARTLRMEYLDPFCENNFSFDSRRMGIHYIIYIIQATHTQRANSHRASGMDGIRRTWSLYIYLWLAHAVVDNKAHANQFSRMNTALMCAQSIIFHVCVVLLRPFENHISSDRRWNWNSQLSVSFLHSSSSPYPIPHL